MFESVFEIIAGVGFVSVLLWFIVGAKDSVNLNNFSEKDLKDKDDDKV